MHPLFYELTRFHLKQQLRRAGYNPNLADDATNDLIDAAVSAQPIAPPPFAGGFLAQLIADIQAFLNSPNGQAILAVIMQMILAALSGS